LTLSVILEKQQFNHPDPPTGGSGLMNFGYQSNNRKQGLMIHPV